ncbi:MAG: hypothetical protein LWW79_11220 [Holophagaceae bacterium]|nr:hypothetical protein [Holophagaceae bacterium]
MTIIRTFALTAVLASALLAQTPPAAPTPQVKPADPDLATLRAMKSRLFVIQFRDALQLQRALSALGSGANGATMRFNNEGGLNTIGVRDFPENLTLIEEAIKRLDVPTAAPASSDVELTLQVLFASKGAAPEGGLPADLVEVVKQLKGALAYRGYVLAASFVQRVQVLDNARSETGGLGHVLPGALGAADAKDTSRLKLEWRAQGLKLDGHGEGPALLDVGSFRLDLEEATPTHSGTLAKFSTPLSLREGERVVVGTSVVKDHGVVVVLTARRIKR